MPKAISNNTPSDASDQETPPGPTETVTIGDTRVTLLGTAHVSRTSAEEVARFLASGDYDAVAVELCPSRYRTLTQPDSWGETDLFRVIREGRAGTLAAHLAVSAYQQRLAEQLGVDPGAEMRAAIDAADEQAVPLWLIDREVGITLKRLLWGVPWTHRLALVGGLLTSFLSREKVTEDDIERLKEGDVLESTFGEFAEHSPRLYNHLVGERDRFMAARLRQEVAASRRSGSFDQGVGDGVETGNRDHVLAVVGAGHLAGMVDELSRSDAADPATTIDELNQMPPRRRWLRAIPWLVVAAVAVAFVMGFRQSAELGFRLMGEWVVINGALSALGAAIAGAHVLTVAGAFVAAPITSLNPTVGAGMVVAAIETGLRRPRVTDFDSLRSDITHLKGWWRNRVARILLVFIMSTMGSAIGTYLAGFRIIEQLVR
ncbi:TraB/GumN family protein [Thiohalorhabdus sp.]|uniref:TraB/GumN family protein n=1 Tax=Thiohalorhabdus sp. TaxID=3094134 RepID=UPI002FC38537